MWYMLKTVSQRRDFFEKEVVSHSNNKILQPKYSIMHMKAQKKNSMERFL